MRQFHFIKVPVFSDSTGFASSDTRESNWKLHSIGGIRYLAGVASRRVASFLQPACSPTLPILRTPDIPVNPIIRCFGPLLCRSLYSCPRLYTITTTTITISHFPSPPFTLSFHIQLLLSNNLRIFIILFTRSHLSIPSLSLTGVAFLWPHGYLKMTSIEQQRPIVASVRISERNLRVSR